METLENVIKTATDLKPQGYYDQIDNSQSEITATNTTNTNTPDTPSPLSFSINSEQKWRQTKVLSSDSIITNCGNNFYSPDCNVTQTQQNSQQHQTAATFSTIIVNNNNGSNNDPSMSLSTGSSTSTFSGNGSLKNKNLSYHRLRKSATISSTDKAKLSRDKRANILREILSTEQAYISFLKILVEVYLLKIKDIGLSDQDIDGIFSNIEAIKLANEDILLKLKEKIEQASSSFPDFVEISDVFLEFGPFLKIYSIFVNNYYNKAISIIKLNTSKNNKFKLYLAECKSLPASKKLDLNDLMIMPIQRLVRYVLLLEELIQHTPESSESNEHNKLIEAKNVMKDVASFVNQSTVDKQGPLETLARVQQILGPKTGNLIQPHRRFIKSGDLVRVVQLDNDYINSEVNNSNINENTSIVKNRSISGGSIELIEKRVVNIYLFNDLLIYGINNKFWRKIYLVEVWVRPKEINGLENVFEVYSKSLSCIFQNQFSSNSSSTFQEWSTLIQITINKLLIDDPDAKEKRLNLLDQDDQIQKDFTFEERQFYFETLNSNGNNLKNTNFKDSLIEDGIVEDRKKKIENLIIFQQSTQQPNNNKESTGNTDYSDNMASSVGGFSDNSDNEQVSKNNNTTITAAGGFSDSSDNEEAKKKISVLKKRMLSQQLRGSGGGGNSNSGNGDSTDGLQRTSSSVSLFTQQLMNSGKSKQASSLSHIVLTKQNIVVQGYLTKIGEVVKNWKRRWFIFESNYLFYLKNENTSKILGIIPLIGSKIENIDHTSFNITTTSRTYLIIADSQQDLSKWTKSILEFYSSRNNFINNIKLQYSNKTTSTTSTTTGTLPYTTTTATKQQQKRLSWLSAALPNGSASFKRTQNDRSKTIANFRFSAILNENASSPDSLSKSVDALTCNTNDNNNNNSENSDQNNSSNQNSNQNNNDNDNNANYEDCDSLSSEEEFDSEEEYGQ